MISVFFDSSVWISLFSQDVNSQKAMRIIENIPMPETKVFMPIIIYIEVLNCLKRNGMKTRELRKIIQFFQRSSKIKLLYPTKTFWRRHILKYTKKVNLKTLDLLIVAFAIELETDKFYTFDVKLNKAYQHLIDSKNRIYES